MRPACKHCTCCSCEEWISGFLFNSVGNPDYTRRYKHPAMFGLYEPLCKHIWIGVLSTGGKNSGNNLLRVSMIEDGSKESRTPMESTGDLPIVSKGVCLAMVVKYI